MSGAEYTPGWTPQVSAFMERRTADSHARVVREHLRPGMDLLDLGCGPGSITVGLARAVAPGRVTAIDREASQLRLLIDRAGAGGLGNLDAAVGDALALPLGDDAVDEAIRFYERIQTTSGGDVRAGRALGARMRDAGLRDVAMSARYEVYEDRAAIADYLATRIEACPDRDRSVELGWASGAHVRGMARALREWSAIPGGMFAQAWVSATGRVAPG